MVKYSLTTDFFMISPTLDVSHPGKRPRKRREVHGRAPRVTTPTLEFAPLATPLAPEREDLSKLSIDELCARFMQAGTVAESQFKRMGRILYYLRLKFAGGMPQRGVKHGQTATAELFRRGVTSCMVSGASHGARMEPGR